MKTFKSLSIIAVILILSSQSYAQSGYSNTNNRQNTPKPQQSNASFNPTGYVIATLGLAAPVGNFSYNTSTNYGGYALPGITETISAGIPLANTNLGVAALFSNYDNPFDINAYTNNVALSNNNYQFYSVRSDDYVENAFMAGVFYTWPVGIFSFDLRGMGGFLICDLPGVTYGANATDPLASNDFQWDYSSSRSLALGYDLGAAIRCKISKNLCISLMGDFMGARSPYSTYLTYTDQHGYQTVSTVNGSIPISTFNVSLGLGYQFE